MNPFSSYIMSRIYTMCWIPSFCFGKLRFCPVGCLNLINVSFFIAKIYNW